MNIFSKSPQWLPRSKVSHGPRPLSVPFLIHSQAGSVYIVRSLAFSQNEHNIKWSNWAGLSFEGNTENLRSWGFRVLICNLGKWKSNQFTHSFNPCQGYLCCHESTFSFVFFFLPILLLPRTPALVPWPSHHCNLRDVFNIYCLFMNKQTNFAQTTNSWKQDWLNLWENSTVIWSIITPNSCYY